MSVATLSAPLYARDFNTPNISTWTHLADNDIDNMHATIHSHVTSVRALRQRRIPPPHRPIALLANFRELPFAEDDSDDELPFLADADGHVLFN